MSQAKDINDAAREAIERGASAEDVEKIARDRIANRVAADGEGEEEKVKSLTDYIRLGHQGGDLQRFIDVTNPKVLEVVSGRQPAGPSESSTRLTIDFFRRFGPRHVTEDGKIYFAKLQTALRPQNCHSLPTALDFLRTTPDYIQQCGDKGDLKPNTHFSLARNVLGTAAIQLASQLPMETASGDRDAIDLIRDELIAMLIRPRRFNTTSGVPIESTYAQWLMALVPEDRWRQCHNHFVFGYVQGKAPPRFAIKSQFALVHCRRMARSLKTAERTGPFLLKANLIERNNRGRSSHVVNVERHSHRVWILSAEVVDAACGNRIVQTDASEPEME